MPRNLNAAFQTALTSPSIIPAFLAELTFSTGTYYAWTGVGELSWNGQTWSGLGDLATIGVYNEETSVTANGLTLTLSGINNTLLGDSMSEIQLGAPATIYFALLNPNGTIIGTPTVFFGGIVDKPSVTLGTDTCTISLALETNFIRLQQGQRLKYTKADQRRLVPGDSGYDWVERLNDIALIWQ